jgi:lipoprotein-anchoring transpeptidase ErfK/SrfK
MKALMLGKLVMVVVAAVVLTAQALAQQAATTANAPSRVIVVSLEDRKLALVEDGQAKKIYTVAVGKPSTPSPEGTFTIARRVANPIYRHNDKVVMPGPHNPVGTRWMGLSIPGYGIHGTNEPNSIGKAASHGCIRMAKTDLEEFYELVAVGDTVKLIGRRNEETTQLFGTEPAPAVAPAAQPTLLAKADPTEMPAAAEAQATSTTTDATATHATAIVAALR